MNWTSLSGAGSSPIRADRNGERGRRARSFRRLAENTRAAHQRTISRRLPRTRSQSAGRRLERPGRSRSPLEISSFPSPPPPIRMAVVKHKGKATQAALKLIFWTLVALLCVVVIGFASILLGSFLTGIARLLFGLWMLFALFCLWFFRDPNPNVPSDPSVIVAPAHGKVDVIDETAEPEFLGGPCRRISIFLSVIEVHVQRAPVAGRIVYLKHTPGRFMSALKQE